MGRKKQENQMNYNLATTLDEESDNFTSTLNQLKDNSEEKVKTVEDRLTELKKALKGKSIHDFKVVIYYNDKYLETVPAVDVDFENLEEWLKNRHGGGTFAVEVRKNGSIFIHRNYLRFTILGESKINPSTDKGFNDPVYSLMADTLSKVANKIEQLEVRLSNQNNENYMISFMQLMMEQNKANQQMMLELLKLNQQTNREKSFIEKLIEGLTIDKLVVLGSSVFPAVKEFFANISGGSVITKLAPVLEKNPHLLEKVIARELGINEGNIIETILSDPELLKKTLEVVNNLLAKPTNGDLTQYLPAPKQMPAVQNPSNTEPQESKIQQEGNMFKTFIQSQISNILQKLIAIKEGLKNGEFENVAVAVDYVFAPAEIDMFLGYMDQFNINTADDLINVLSNFGIDLSDEINHIGKDLLEDVIKYLNGDDVQEEKQ
jgi:exonuclease VII large subunit